MNLRAMTERFHIPYQPNEKRENETRCEEAGLSCGCHDIVMEDGEVKTEEVQGRILYVIRRMLRRKRSLVESQ